MAAHAFVIADRAGVIRVWSAGAEAAFGHSAARAVGETLDVIVPAELRDAHWRGFRHAIETGTAAIDGEANVLPVLCADETITEVPGRLTLVRDPQGQVVAVAVAFLSRP